MSLRHLTFPAVVLSLGLAACSESSRQNPAEQFHRDVITNLAAMDYEHALKNLDKMTSAGGDQPMGQMGVTLRIALLTALADGSKQLADAYAAGMRERGAAGRQGQFSRMRADYNGMARVRLLKAMEEVMAQRKKLGDKPLMLEMPFPDFSGTERPELMNIRAGSWVPDAERYRAELETVRNALAHALARVAGYGDDLHKAQAAYKKGGVQIDSRVYLVELSDSFVHLGEIFDRRALDDPRYRRISYEVARDNMDLALKLLEAKPDKDLEVKVKKIRAECEKALKAMG